MKIAICPGSFDPITNGHLDIIRRGAKLFDKVIVCVMKNPGKTGSFTPEERVNLIKAVCTDLPNVTVDSFSGLLVDYAKEQGACAVIKGIRSAGDYEYELQMERVNQTLNPEIETVYLNTGIQYGFLSSSLVKQVAAFDGDLSQFVPSAILNQVSERLTKTNKRS